jgi:hypothetical protein
MPLLLFLFPWLQGGRATSRTIQALSALTMHSMIANVKKQRKGNRYAPLNPTITKT